VIEVPVGVDHVPDRRIGERADHLEQPRAAAADARVHDDEPVTRVHAGRIAEQREEMDTVGEALRCVLRGEDAVHRRPSVRHGVGIVSRVAARVNGHAPIAP
jgi:hypothetical protein